jgi:hypothetical protein
MTTSRALTAAVLLVSCHHGPGDQGMTSAVHRQHVGGMVFAHAVIEKGQEQQAAFIDHCVLGEPCYGRFYLQDSLRAAAHNQYAASFALRATVDGQALPEGLFEMEGWWSTYKFTLFRAPSDDQPWEHPKWFLEQVASRLPPGEHVIELAVLGIPPYGRAGAGAPLAAGKIAMTIPPDARQIIARALPRENQLLAQLKRQQAAYAAQSAQTSSSSESSSSTSHVSFVLEFSGCDKNVDYIIEAPGGGQAGGANSSGTMELQTDVPATICTTDNTNYCKSNKATISASTKRVVTNGCYSLRAE